MDKFINVTGNNSVITYNAKVFFLKFNKITEMIRQIIYIYIIHMFPSCYI